MKKKFVVLFNPPRTDWLAAQEVLVAVGRKRLAVQPKREFGYVLEFDNEGDYEHFVAEAKRRNLPPDSIFARVEKQVSLQQLEAPLVRLKVTSKPRGRGGPSYGTKYDVTKGCPQCGTGSPQISPLYVRSSDAPRRGNVWQTLDNEVLLDPTISTTLVGTTGVEMRQAHSSDDDRVLPWFQLIPLHQLPRMARTTEGIYQDDPCNLCKRDGFYTRMSHTIRYELDLDKVPDVSHTYECFGRSVLATPFAKSHFAQPLVILRRHVVVRLVDAGARDISVDPLEVVDTSPSRSLTPV